MQGAGSAPHSLQSTALVRRGVRPLAKRPSAAVLSPVQAAWEEQQTLEAEGPSVGSSGTCGGGVQEVVWSSGQNHGLKTQTFVSEPWK